MQPGTLSKLIRQSFEFELRETIELAESEAGVPASVIRSMVKAMHDRSVALSAQDELLAHAIYIYRASGRPVWSAIVLEMLGPMLASAESCFPYVPAQVTTDDLCQQLIVECLHAARHMKLPNPARDVQGRIRRMTLRRTAAWLRRMSRGGGDDVELTEQAGQPVRYEERLFIRSLVDSGVSPENLTLLYRSHVLGMTAREIARETSLSVNAVYMRQRRALERLQEWNSTRFRRTSDAIPAAA
jgi:DNA-directed RNA polymerase specialized sigma24 family protein